MWARLRKFGQKHPRDKMRAISATLCQVYELSLKRFASILGYELRRIYPTPVGIPDAALYQPRYSPWLGADFARYFAMAAPRSLVTPDRCYVLYTLLKQAMILGGDVVECGVYRGGTAAMMARMITESGTGKKLYLFDTFGGMPKTDAVRDWHKEGDFSDNSLAEVEAFVGMPETAVFRKGLIPDTFVGLETLQIAFAHIDVDIYRSILDSIAFIWPRLASGGVRGI